MVYLITGATGFVGKHIVQKCREKNITVHYLTTSKNKIQNTEQYKGFLWNPRTGYINTDVFLGVTTIIHLAGASIAKRWTKSYQKEIINSRIDSANLIKKSLSQIEHQVVHFVSASAIGVYKDSLTEYYIEESPVAENSFLSEVVNLWEQSANQFTKLGVKVSKIRIGLVLDGKEGALPQLVNPIKWYIGTAFGKGNQWQSWIHVKDLASIFMLVSEKQLTGVYNAVSPNAVTQNKLIVCCASLLQKPIWLPNIPKIVTKLLFGKMSAVLLESQRVSSAKIEAEGFLFEFPALRKALQFILKK